MTLAFTATRRRSLLVTLMVVLACAQSACSLRSLEFLQNGAKSDGGGDIDSPGRSNPDTASSQNTPLDAIKPDGTALDATAIEARLGSDSSSSDGPDGSSNPTLDGQVERTGDLGPDTFIPIAGNADGGPLDAQNPDDAALSFDSRPNVDIPLDSPVPDGTVPVLDSPVLVPDSSVPVRDSPVLVLDSPVLVPDSSVPRLDTAVLVPDSSVLAPDSAPLVPDGAPLVPDSAPFVPDSAPLVPDSAVPVPDSSVPVLDGSIHTPELYYQAGITNVGTTYTNPLVDLGSQSNTLVVVNLAWDNSAVANPTITYAGSSMNLAKSDTVNGQALAIYYMVRPPAGISTLNVTFASSVNLSVGILGLRNVNSSSPVSPKGMTSANWASLTSGGDMIYDGSLALVYNISTTGNNEIPTVSGDPYAMCQSIAGRPTSPYLRVGVGYCPTAGSYSWTFAYGAAHWQGITVMEIRRSP
jgi:hypothetical protein